jgi:hypothetical protein
MLLRVQTRRPAHRSRCHRNAAAIWVLALGLFLPTLAAADDPLNTVRAFCAADGRGDRLDPRRWSKIAPLVAWRLEPAWDRVMLVQGYQVGTPIRSGDEVTVAVDYTVLAEVGPGTVGERTRVERRTFRLGHDEGDDRWRILPPPPPPYVFRSDADAEAMSKLLDVDTARYVSASELVWRLANGAGWDLPHTATAALADSPYLYRVENRRAGDLVFYFDGDLPYHVGMLEKEDEVVSATLNAGIRRTPIDAFAGAVQYRRLLTRPRETPTAEPSTPAAESSTPVPAATPTPTSPA